ncbi:eggshell protein 2A-like isoform X2 [Hemicordylus capensis]|uniref:eggshell protein 2A-like isoform X2 n=1 Tax=Hemicordylus capensis TaxID=884348 RepID=UPI0023022113|nr:eggshell protein 2A-like isoform X2 [Hemicordylus capensis]
MHGGSSGPGCNPWAVVDQAVTRGGRSGPGRGGGPSCSSGGRIGWPGSCGPGAVEVVGQAAGPAQPLRRGGSRSGPGRQVAAGLAEAAALGRAGDWGGGTEAADLAQRGGKIEGIRVHGEGDNAKILMGRKRRIFTGSEIPS